MPVEPSLTVIYLARYAEGTHPFKRFIDSYRSNPAGITHNLVVLFKGFPDLAASRSHKDILQGVHHTEHCVSDAGLDLTAYFDAVQSISASSYCFLNTFSRILCSNWLALMAKHLEDPSVGLVGATGSYESPATNFNHGSPDSRKLWKRAGWVSLRYRLYFDPFPNPHIRSNAFLLKKETLDRIKVPKITEKMDAYRFESGKQSITNQIKNLHLKAVIAGKNGKSYDEKNWCESGTFRASRQENLIIADNQTDLFEQSPLERQEELSRLAWDNQTPSSD